MKQARMLTVSMQSNASVDLNKTMCMYVSHHSHVSAPFS